MIGENSYNLVRTGLCIRYLCNTGEGFPASDVLEICDSLKFSLASAGFEVSISGFDLFDDCLLKMRKLASDERIGAALAKSVCATAHIFENIVFAEAQTKKIYLLPKRRFNGEFLLTSPQRLMKSGSFERLSDIARSDISSACRCILFGEATAAAFHVLRASEEVLKLYYFKHIRIKRLSKPMWAAMVNELRGKKTNVPPKVLLDSLDMIRVSYRNPTQHPDALYDIEQAQDLFGVCIDLIGKMAMELGSPTSKI